MEETHFFLVLSFAESSESLLVERVQDYPETSAQAGCMVSLSTAVDPPCAIDYGIMGREVDTEVVGPVFWSLFSQGVTSASSQVNLLEEFFLQATQ